MLNTLTIPDWHPATVNRLYSGHWSKRARLKRGDAAMVWYYAKEQEIPLADGKRRVSLVLTFAKGQRCPDEDAHWKSTLDALVHARLLIDDSPKWCVLGTVSYCRSLVGVRQTEIVLEDA